MARLYADEDFPLPVVEGLRLCGHDVLTVKDAGRAGQGIDDADVLADAIADQRTLLTHNHADFLRLHRRDPNHAGIVSCSQDPTDHAGLALRIDSALASVAILANQFIRVVRPNLSSKP